MPVFFFRWLLVFASGPAVTVNGDATCPTAEEVSTRVAQLVPAVDTAAPRDLARIEEAGGVVRVSLWRPDGALVATRELSRTGSCADLAAAAAVVVAAWESDVHPEFMPFLGPVAPSKEVAAAVPAAVVRTPSKPTPTRVVFEVGAALSGSVAPGAGGAAPAAGGLIVASVASSHRSVGLRLMLAGSAERGDPPRGWARALATARRRAGTRRAPGTRIDADRRRPARRGAGVLPCGERRGLHGQHERQQRGPRCGRRRPLRSRQANRRALARISRSPGGCAGSARCRRPMRPRWHCPASKRRSRSGSAFSSGGDRRGSGSTAKIGCKLDGQRTTYESGGGHVSRATAFERSG